MIKHWHMWIDGHLYTMFCVNDHIHYEGNGPYIVEGKQQRPIADNH